MFTVRLFTLEIFSAQQHKNIENTYFDPRLKCTVPKHWLKYKTGQFDQFWTTIYKPGRLVLWNSDAFQTGFSIGISLLKSDPIPCFPLKLRGIKTTPYRLVFQNRLNRGLKICSKKDQKGQKIQAQFQDKYRAYMPYDLFQGKYQAHIPFALLQYT